MNPELDYIRIATWNTDDYLTQAAALSRAYQTNKGAWLQYRGRKSDDGRMFFGLGEQARKRHHVIQFTGGLAEKENHRLMTLPESFYCTRLDIQVTIKEPAEHNAEALYKSLHRKGKSFVQSPGCATVYIGVRTSDLFTRIYEKPTLSGRFLRCEFELKGSYARAAYVELKRKMTTKQELFQRCLNQAKVPKPHREWFTTQADAIGGLTAADKERSLATTKNWLNNTESGIMRHLGHEDTRNMVLDFIERLEVAKSFVERFDAAHDTKYH